MNLFVFLVLLILFIVVYITRKYLYILNELNVLYYLSFGSELQAYRDGYKKRNDQDIDINSFKK